MGEPVPLKLQLVARPDVNPLAQRLLKAAHRFAHHEDEPVAFALVVLTAHGAVATAAECRFSDSMLMNRHAFVGMVAEAVRDALITWETGCEATRAVLDLPEPSAAESAPDTELDAD